MPMGPALNAELHIVEPQLRVAENEARAALDAVTGRPAIAARARLRFGPGRTCEPIARLLDRAIVQAERAGLDPERLIVTAGSASGAPSPQPPGRTSANPPEPGNRRRWPAVRRRRPPSRIRPTA